MSGCLFCMQITKCKIQLMIQKDKLNLHNRIMSLWV